MIEHNVQFTIELDESEIKKQIEENAYYDIVDAVLDGVDLDYLLSEKLDQFIADNKEAIIKAAAQEVCIAFKRSNTFKDKMKEAIE